MYIFSWGYIKEKWAHAGFQRYFQNLGWVFGARIASLVISFITTAVVARNLGPENLGQLSYSLSFVAIFGFIATLGVDQVLYRDLIKYPDEKKQYLGTAFILKTISGFIALASCLIFLFFIEKDVSTWLIVILSLSFIVNPFQIIGSEFQARVKSKYPSIASFILVIFLNSLKILTVLLDKGVIYLTLILLLESILGAVIILILYKKVIKDNFFDFKFNKKIALDLLADSWPLIFVSAFATIYTRVDQVLLKHLLDVGSVGLYDAAVRISEVWYFVPNLIVVSFLPAIINARATSENQYNKRLGLLAILLITMSILVAIPITILAPFIIKTIYGTDFLGAISVLQIYIWAGLGMSLGMLTNTYLVTENLRKILFITSFIAMLSNVILNMIFIPRYGIVGSAWATFISYSLIPLTLIFFETTRQRMVQVIKSLYAFKI